MALLAISKLAPRLLGLLVSAGILVSCLHQPLPGLPRSRVHASLRSAEHAESNLALKENGERALADVIRCAAGSKTPDALRLRRARVSARQRLQAHRRRVFRPAPLRLPRRTVFRAVARSSEAPDPPA